MITLMTEAEWQSSTDYGWMLMAVRHEKYLRKRQLYSVACCQRVGHLGQDDLDRSALEVLERHADGEASEAELKRFADAIRERRVNKGWDLPWANGCVQSAIEMCAVTAAVFAAMAAADADPSTSFASIRDKEFYAVHGREEFAWQTRLLRDIFGNPFRPSPIDPAWLAWHDGAVLSIARAIYQECRFERLPILGDALEEAGCVDEEVLGHCRDDWPHARGCWVVDLILVKS